MYYIRRKAVPIYNQCLFLNNYWTDYIIVITSNSLSNYIISSSIVFNLLCSNQQSARMM